MKHNVHVYNQLQYEPLWAEIYSYLLSLGVGKTYSFAIFGRVLAWANCKWVWLLRWLFQIAHKTTLNL